MTEQERDTRLLRLAQELAELVSDATRRNQAAQTLEGRMTELEHELARLKELVVHRLAELGRAP